MNSNEKGVVALIIGAIAILAGYIYYEMTNLPGDAVDMAKSLEKKIELADNALVDAKGRFGETQKEEAWAFLEMYATREEWSGSLAVADENIQAARKNYVESIALILDRNSKEETDALHGEMAKVRSNLSRAQAAMAKPFDRMSILLTAKNDSAKQIEEAAQHHALSLKGMQVLEARSMSELKPRHAAKAKDIDLKVHEAVVMQESQKKLLDKMKGELSKRGTDYAVYAHDRRDFLSGHKRLMAYLTTTDKKLSELDQSYVKVLADQKIEYWVVVKRTSWCDWDSCFGENDYTYKPVQVDEDTFEYFDNLNVSTAATLRRVNVDSVKWAALGINPRERLPGGDDDAELWVEKTYATPYHKYTTVTNGNVTEGPFVQVTEELFEEHYEHLGMAIVSKPYGYYEDEKITQAEPVGLAMVADPAMVGGRPTGSNQYGEWRTENGNSFWHYYGMYSFFGNLMGSGNRYHYDDWSGYRSRSHRSHYYGRNDEWGTYGQATYRSDRYRNSGFAKRNPSVMTTVSTNRSSKVASSVRSAGSTTRSRGPSGGGK